MILQDIWSDIVFLCRSNPQLLIFLSLAIGYAVGKVTMWGFSLGSTASVLLAALVLGQIDVPITPLIKSIAFALFIFSIGYRVGPQFFDGLKKEGLRYVVLTLFFAVVGLLTAVILGKLFRFTSGTTAGLLAGAMTQSSAIGTAEDAVRALPIDVVQQKMLSADIAVAYALTYIFGVAGLILFYRIVPRLLRMDLKAQAQKLEAELSGATLETQNISDGADVPDPICAALPSEILELYVTNPKVVGQTVETLVQKYGPQCVLYSITRQGHELPLKQHTVVVKGDMLRVIGSTQEVEAFARHVGYPERETKVTDFVVVGLGCFLGTLLGLVTIKMGYVLLTLGTGGGILFAGLFFGWLRSLYPTFGYIPDGAQWLLSELGLNLFIACVGLTAGPRAIQALQSQGATLVFAGVMVTLVPHILGFIFGKLVLRINSVLLLGALTGAGTATPALNVLKDECDSAVPALGYTIPYAIGNCILTIWGTVIINVM